MGTVEERLAYQVNRILEMPEERYRLFLKFLSEQGEEEIHAFAVGIREGREG